MGVTKRFSNVPPAISRDTQPARANLGIMDVTLFESTGVRVQFAIYL